MPPHPMTPRWRVSEGLRRRGDDEHPILKKGAEIAAPIKNCLLLSFILRFSFLPIKLCLELSHMTMKNSREARDRLMTRCFSRVTKLCIAAEW